MVIKNSDGSLYNPNENEEHLAYSQLVSVTYNNDYEITKQYNNAEALK
jgi:hypothetical protein